VGPAFTASPPPGSVRVHTDPPPHPAAPGHQESAMPAVPLSDVAVHLRPADNVAVARTTIPAGAELRFDGATLTVPAAVKLGHKFAVRPIREGDPIHKYGQVIGFAGRDIPAGG